MAEHGGGTHEAGVLRELLAVFGFGVDDSELKKGETALGAFFEKVKHFAEAVTAVFAVDAIYEFVEANVHAMTAIEHSAAQLGVSTEQVQEWQFAAKSLGLEADRLIYTFGRLQVAAQASGKGTGAQSQAFKDIGVHVKDAHGKFKSLDELIPDVAEGIKNQTDQTKRVAAVTALFGREGRRLLPFLIEGREGVRKYADEFKELGGGYSEKAIEKSKEFEHQSARLGLVFTGVKNTILLGLIPAVSWIVEKVAAATAWFGNLAKNSMLLQSALTVLGVVATGFAIKMAIANYPLLLIAAAISAIVVVLDDLMVGIAGGESAIGRLIEAIGGKGADKKFFGWVRDTAKEIRDYFVEAWHALRDLLGLTQNAEEEQKAHAHNDLNRDFTEGQIVNKVLPGQDGGADRRVPHVFKGGELVPLSGTAGGEFQGPLPGGIPAGGGGTVHILETPIVINATVPPGASPREHAEAIGHVVNKVIRERHRAAAATLQRKTGT